MKIREFVIRLAALYNFPITIFDEDTNKSIDHPAIIGAEKWVDDNFADGKRLSIFYNYVIKNFIPTDAVRYPTPGNLEKIYKEYKEFNSTRDKLKPLSQIEHKPITLEDTAKAFAANKGITYLPPDKYIDIDINIVTEKLKTMTIQEGMREFGILLYGESISEGTLSRSKLKRNEDRKLKKIF